MRETLLVLDAQTGQNGIAQARAFTEAVEVTGVVLTKTDGSAKGGIVLAVREELDLPIRFVGVGEGPDDLRPFDARSFADRLLAEGPAWSARILIVEDHPTMREAMRLVLEGEGFAIDEAADGARRWRRCARRPPRPGVPRPQHPRDQRHRRAGGDEGRSRDRGRPRDRRDGDRRGRAGAGDAPRAPTSTSPSRSVRSRCCGRSSGCWQGARRRERDAERRARRRRSDATSIHPPIASVSSFVM